MNLKKMIIVNTIITFCLAFLCHFLYDWFPNPLFAIIFPVNESIWEHMKMLFTTILLSGILEYKLLNIYKINYNNFLIALLTKALLSIPTFLIIYLPLYHKYGEIMWITLTLMFLVILLVNYLGYLILSLRKINYQKEISIIFIIIIYIFMGILTFYPPEKEIFIPPINN